MFRAVARLARTTHVTPSEVKAWLLQRGRVRARRGPGQGESASGKGPGGAGRPAGLGGGTERTRPVVTARFPG